MPVPRSTTDDRQHHWDAAYTGRGVEQLSWYQSDARVSLELIGRLGIDTGAALIDVGGGASVLAGQLVARGFRDVSVLDLSAEALAVARSRAGADAPIHWLHGNVLTWRPSRRYDLWHDRAALHFLVDAHDRDTYMDRLREMLQPSGAAVIGVFALDGPPMCSGLPVARYSTEQLADLLGIEFDVVARRREEHVTPSGVLQPFTWIAARRAN